jgi:NAD(P)-dependent dehydrogenase (short-subunit alcohol dehydrogenase family)
VPPRQPRPTDLYKIKIGVRKPSFRFSLEVPFKWIWVSKGKTAVVSGSTTGIGFAIVATRAAEGAKVIVNGRTEARVTADLRGIPADLGAASGVEKFLQQAPEADVVVNNLDIFETKPFLEISDSNWLRFFEVNVLSEVRL